MRTLTALAASALLAATVALPAMAEEGSGSSTGSEASVSAEAGMRFNKRALKAKAKAGMKAKKGGNLSIDVVCAQAAVNKRESALGSGFASFSSAVSSAYATRASELSTAWSNSDATARKIAIRAAWDKFQKSAKSARETWKDTKKNAWRAFKEEIRNCRGSANEEANGEGIDESL